MKRSSQLFFLTVLALLTACSSLNPSHFAKYTFRGKLNAASGKPVPNASIRIRGWETFSREDGSWQADFVLSCGALHDHMDGFEEKDKVEIVAEGFAPAEEPFLIRHPVWFLSCKREEELLEFKTTLQPEKRKAEAEEKK